MTTTDQKTPRFYLAMLASKAAVGALDLTHHRGGQVPGVVAEKIDPDFLSHIDKPDHVVFVSGTNGKTTTTNLLSDLLVDNGYGLVTNRAGGNICTGIESTLIKNAAVSGAQRESYAVMELDEVSFRPVLPRLEPELLLVTNLYTDTFTRSADPDYVFGIMSRHISENTRLVLNADDLISCRMAPQNHNKVFFSIEATLPDDTPDPQGIVCDLTACPVCGGRLEYDYCHLRHLGRAHCASCGLTNPEAQYVMTSVDLDAHTFTVEERLVDGHPRHDYHFGTYTVANLYNLFAATVAAREMGLTPEQIARSLDGKVNITAERYSERTVEGRRIVNIASKGENGTATSVAFDTIRKEPGTKAVVLMLSDAHMAEHPTEVEFSGWIYQADYEYLVDPQVKQVIVVGDTATDQVLRMCLAGVDPSLVTQADGIAEAMAAVRYDDVDTTFIAFCVSNVDVARGAADLLATRIEGAHHER